ncbi:hypothetical protein AAG906_003830 [Vitis piasezkii]
MSGFSDSTYPESIHDRHFRLSGFCTFLGAKVAGNVPSARIYSFVVSAINEEKPTLGKASDLRPWRFTSLPLTSFWERMRNSISVGKDTWKPLMLVLTMVLIHGCCLKGWDEPHRGEVGKMKSQPNALHAKAEMYTLNESKICSYDKKSGGARTKRCMKCKLLLKHQDK